MEMLSIMTDLMARKLPMVLYDVSLLASYAKLEDFSADRRRS